MNDNNPIDPRFPYVTPAYLRGSLKRALRGNLPGPEAQCELLGAGIRRCANGTFAIVLAVHELGEAFMWATITSAEVTSDMPEDATFRLDLAIDGICKDEMIVWLDVGELT